MARDLSATILSQLGSPDQAAVALRQLKNEIVGHVQRKEQWIRQGVLRYLVEVLKSGEYDQINGKDARPSLADPRMTERQSVKLQVLQLLASIATPGPAFLPPLHASGAISAILDHGLQDEQPRVLLAALRALRDIAEAATFAPSTCPIETSKLADVLFSSPHWDSFARIISQTPTTRDQETQVMLVATLIEKLCREERHQLALVNCGILDLLATRLASFAVADGQVIPRAEVLARAEGLSEYIPGPARSTESLSSILGAIAAIITDSPYRACKLLYSPSILAVFPVTDGDSSGLFESAPQTTELAGLRPTRQRDLDPMDFLLPHIPAQLRGHTSHQPVFPPLGGPASRYSVNGRSAKLTAKLSPWSIAEETFGSSADTDPEEAESPLIPWLLSLVRSHRGMEALQAASVLTSLFKAGFAYKSRETSLGLLVVPILLQTLEDAEANVQYDGSTVLDPVTASRWNIIEQTPAVLARLMTDSESLQKAAFECNAVKTISRLLKSTYEQIPSLTATQVWSPADEEAASLESLQPECKLGDAGKHPLQLHRVQVRENALRALGALATFKEDYRTAIIEQDVIPCILESLNPAAAIKPADGLGHIEPGENAADGQDGSPLSVTITACYAVRMLSRSVNILRTTMIDHGIAMPIFKLLRHPEVEIQIAATAAMCNLVTDFSPMRDSLVEAGVLKVLCEQAHSQNASLRLNALWALKHLVHSASLSLKKMCLQELKSEWLIQLICEDTEDDALFTARSRQSIQGILDEMDEDVDMNSADDSSRPWLSASFYRPSSSSSRAREDSRIMDLAATRLAALREAETNPVRKARQDDLAIQEQGLGFIRNLTEGGHPSSSGDSTTDTMEMIDFLFNLLGQDRFFDILASKLRVKVLHPFSRRGTGSGGETRVLYPQTKIIEAVIYNLVHIAASIPRHRQLIISQTELLKLLATLFSSQDREVRVALCHLVNNLTWQDDVDDASACTQRAQELRKLGFYSKLDTLSQSDDELDVRERAKSALWQMKHG